jgi:hypothetical protein
MSTTLRTSKIFLLALLVAFAMSMAISTSAQAAPNWKVNGTYLKAAQVVKVKTGNTETWKWNDGLKVTCSAKGKEELIGIGENQYNSYLFEGCSVSEPANCSIKEVTALNVGAPKWHTKLVADAGKIFVEVEKAEVQVVVEGAGCPATLTRNVTGNYRYEWTGDGGPIVAEDQKLESNEAVSMEGSETVELEESGTLETGEEKATGEEAPFWTVGGTRLEKGQTRFITTKEAQPIVLSVAGLKITCTETGVAKGAVLLGSEPGESGTDNETVNFKTCKVEGNGSGAECERITEPITTVNLKSELVLDKAKTKLLVLLQPSSGSILAELKFPSGCKFTGFKATGSLLVEVLNEKEEAVTTSSSAKQYKSGFLRFPAMQPVFVWLIKEGKGKEIEAKAFEMSGISATVSGTALVSLESGAEWSALA